MSRKISYWNTEELGTDNKGNGRSIKKNEEAIQQEKEKPTRTKGQRQHVAGEQEYPFKSTLKKVG